jgi:hypothetical protein
MFEQISKGRKELLSHDILPDRIRSKGGGRPSLKKNYNPRRNRKTFRKQYSRLTTQCDKMD